MFRSLTLNKLKGKEDLLEALLKDFLNHLKPLLLRETDPRSMNQDLIAREILLMEISLPHGQEPEPPKDHLKVSWPLLRELSLSLNSDLLPSNSLYQCQCSSSQEAE